jgi:hypothetical protein
MTETTNDMNASISFGGAATPAPVRHRGAARKLRKQLERDVFTALVEATDAIAEHPPEPAGAPRAVEEVAA